MNDLISRQAALKAVDWDTEAYTAILNLPSAVKRGKWVLITKDYIDPQGYMCSVCGRTIKYYGIPALLLEMYPYCNCGARMYGVEKIGHWVDHIKDF